ncbi:MAG TPA: excinuclease ABC subunit UvrB [Bacteroidales bacterium]|nr:excinuclease ABC subunit UvrB [Bacteroidales bacterium]HOU98905.1 excinuclease ABC subunit UvrB [Bacteroidales bacterium]
MNFELFSSFKPTGDQPEAIQQLTDGLLSNTKFQTLLGVTGSGKTFTIANVLANVNRPTLVLSHNKTLAAQLYSEFKQFFPNNKVEYFVSYYDYYQPEAYIPASDTYIEKDLSINEEIEKLRLSATSSLLSGRRDVIVVSSVSCIYGIGNPDDFYENVILIKKNQKIARDTLLRKMVDSLYSRSEVEFKRGNFRVKGETVDIFLAYGDEALRIIFWGDTIEEIYTIHPETGKTIEEFQEFSIYPANIFVTSKSRLQKAIEQIQDDMVLQVLEFKKQNRLLEAQRLEERVTFDLEMIKELGYCSGIENYSRYFDGRKPGSRPFCLLDYFPKDFITVIDESHVTLPQLRGMYGGDRSRKENLVEYGFRLPAAKDNRPLKYDEFMSLVNQVIFVSATPAEEELKLSEGVIVEQVVRPTGIMDPVIEVRPSQFQVDDLLKEIKERIKLQQRVLVTTLTKRMAEELSKYLLELDIKCSYIHSDVDTLKRIEIMDGLRNGQFDVLIGVNLLREGLDLPEVSLVAILDADKEGFLRSERSLTQTAGRAARHLEGKVIMYADKITESMQRTINETQRRREKQMKYNVENNITPTQIVKNTKSLSSERKAANEYTVSSDANTLAADPVSQYMTREQLQKAIKESRRKMEEAAKNLDFMEAAMYRDEMFRLQDLLKSK